MNELLAVALAREALPTFGAVRLPRQDLESLALRRLAWLLEQAARTPFYQSRLDDVGWRPGPPASSSELLDRLRALPPVSKQQLRAAGVNALRDARRDPRWRSSFSSGSSGEPFRVFYDARAWTILKFWVKMRARHFCGVRPWHRIAVLDAVPPDRAATAPLERTGRLRTISVLQPMERVAAALADFMPDAIYGLPSALVDAANAGIDIRASIRPRWLFTGGELLSGPVRQQLQSSYGGRVYDVYGTSETKEIAWECPRGNLHVNSDVVWVEVLNAAGEPAASGEEGDLVVSVLVNGAMPLVRYRTDDRGSLIAEPCSCGSTLPRMGLVSGRVADTLRLEGGRRVSPYALTCALETIRDLHRYQVIQQSRAGLQVRAQAAPGADRSLLRRQIPAKLHAAIPDLSRVEVEFVDGFDTGARAKFRVVQPLSEEAAHPGTSGSPSPVEIS